MSKKKILIYSGLFVALLLAWLFSDSTSDNEAFSERVKISLREVGNQLLLVNKDSTSIILPVIEQNNSQYELSFQNTLSFEPNQLVSIVDNIFKKTALSNYYLVEVLQCSDNEVAYSYQISAEKENTIIPCAGRYLPEACYTIQVKFTKRVAPFFNKTSLLYLLIACAIIFLIDFFFLKRKVINSQNAQDDFYETIGNFQFYPEQNKLVKAATEISLSKKECELLEIFVANPNQIVKRDELTKRVWEDNGVFVGRSLDTYISKLRKKLKEDESIKLTNVHGVGYKLEVGS